MKRTRQALRLAVVGTGALGSALLQRLAAAGMRSVLLIDPDTVELRNLPLSPYLQEALSTRAASASLLKKATLLAEHAWAAHRLPWRAMPCDVASVGWQRLRTCDLLCCCTDSALSRVELAFIAHTLRKPVLDGAVLGLGVAEGRVTQFPAQADAACYLCGLGEERRASVLGIAASAALGCRVLEEAGSMTGTRASLDLVADRMAAVIEDLAQGHAWGPASCAMRLRSNTSGQMDELVQLTRSKTCPWHESAPDPLENLPWHIPIQDSLLQMFPEREVVLDWPVCTEAVCDTCGRRCAPFQRVAIVRRLQRCSRCSAATLQPLTVVSRVRAADALAAYTPRQLGQPARHLYRLRASADTLRCMNLREQ